MRPGMIIPEEKKQEIGQLYLKRSAVPPKGKNRVPKKITYKKIASISPQPRRAAYYLPLEYTWNNNTL